MSEYTAEDIKGQIKPLSKNAFVRFFQRIARGWLGIWYGFSEKHPVLSAWIYKIGFFFAFSFGVTIWQYIVMTFLPYAFSSLNNGAWGWPSVPVSAAGGEAYVIFGDLNGLGYFIAFEIAVFTAQCINFPLQRNITYHSHGNPWYQAMWYFIGWILVSVFTLALWGIINCFVMYWGWPEAVTGLIKTFITGGVSLIIFFFIFMIIFPDNAAAAKRAKAKYEKLVQSGASAEKIAAAEAKMKAAEKAALLSDSEKEYIKAKSQASSKAMKYFAAVKALSEFNLGVERGEDAAAKAKANYERLSAENAPAGKIAAAYAKKQDAQRAVEERSLFLNERVQKRFAEATEAIEIKARKETEFNAVRA